jgi:hypothetical protein
MEMSRFVKGKGQIREVTWTSTGQIQQVRGLMEMSLFLSTGGTSTGAPVCLF